MAHREALGDGTYKLTRARSGGVGIGVGVGFDFSATVDSQTYGLGATAKANVALVGGGGESYIATSEEQARNILDQKRNDETKDSLVGDDNPVRDGVDWLNDKLGGSNKYEQLDPDEWFVEAGIEGEASAGASTPLGTVGAEAAIEAYLGRTNRADGTSTDYLRAEMSIGGGMEGRGPNAQGYDTFINYTAEGSAGAVIEVDRDKDGNPVTFRIKSVLMGNATGDSSYSGPVEDDPEYTERTIDIPLDSAAGRQTAARVLQAAGVPYYPGITDSVDIPQIAQDKLDPTTLGRELGALAAARGHISEQTYTLGTSEDGFNAEGELGVQWACRTARSPAAGPRRTTGTGTGLRWRTAPGARRDNLLPARRPASASFSEVPHAPSSADRRPCGGPRRGVHPARGLHVVVGRRD